MMNRSATRPVRWRSGGWTADFAWSPLRTEALRAIELLESQRVAEVSTPGLLSRALRIAAEHRLPSVYERFVLDPDWLWREPLPAELDILHVLGIARPL